MGGVCGMVQVRMDTRALRQCCGRGSYAWCDNNICCCCSALQSWVSSTDRMHQPLQHCHPHPTPCKTPPACPPPLLPPHCFC